MSDAQNPDGKRITSNALKAHEKRLNATAKELSRRKPNPLPLGLYPQLATAEPNCIILRRGVSGKPAIHDYLEVIKPEKFGLERSVIVKAVEGSQASVDSICETLVDAMRPKKLPNRIVKKVDSSTVDWFVYLIAEISQFYARPAGNAYLQLLSARLKIEVGEIEQAVRKAEKEVAIISKSAIGPTQSARAIASNLGVNHTTVSRALAKTEVSEKVKETAVAIGRKPKTES